MNRARILQRGFLATLSYKVAKYAEIAKVNYSNNATYLTNLLSRGGIVVLRIWIFTQLYKVTYSVSGVTEIGGLTVAMVIWGLMMTQSFQAATRPPHISRIIEDEVKSGSLAYSINRPYSYIPFHFFGFLGRSLPNILINLFVGSLAALILVGTTRFTFNGLIFGSILFFFGYTLDFLISLIIGLFAFWVEEVMAFTWIYNKAQLVFGGLVIPLSLLPKNMRRVAELSPFSQSFYAPARIVVNFDFALFERFLITQLVWISIFGIIAYTVFKKGIKNVSINGG